MKLLSCCIFLLIFSSAWSAPYALLKQMHGFENCVYYDVEIWDDRKTTDTSDDMPLGSTTLRDCQNILRCDSKMNCTTILESVNQINNGDCTVYNVQVLNAQRERMIRGTILNADCQSNI